MRKEFTKIAFMVDLARQVESPEALKRIITWGAEFGYNELFLYGEGGFSFKSHPKISYPWAINQEEYRDIEDFAAKLSINIIPIIPLLGHASYIVRDPELRHLNELQDKEQAVLRCESADLCTTNPDTLKLAEELISEWVEVSNSLYIHLGGDEAWHFAQCAECLKRVEAIGRGKVLAEYFNELNKLVKRHGRQMMIWHDMLFYYDNTLEYLDKDIIICPWHYKPIETHPRTSLYNHKAVAFADEFEKYGFKSYFCSKSKYDYEYESRNIASLLDYYSDRPALGYMNTVWCMKQLPFASCMPSFAYGAARANNPELSPGNFLNYFAKKNFSKGDFLSLLLESSKEAFEFPMFSCIEKWIDYQLPEKYELLSKKMRSAILMTEQLNPLTEIGGAYQDALLLLFKRCELFACFKALANNFALGGKADFKAVLELVPEVLQLEKKIWNEFRPSEDKNPAEEAILKIPKAVEHLCEKQILPTVLELSVVNNDCAFQDISIMAQNEKAWENCDNSPQCGPFGEYKIFFPVPAGTNKIKVQLYGLGELLIRYALLHNPETRIKPDKISNIKGNIKNEERILVDDYTFLHIGTNANKSYLASGKAQPLSEFEITFENI